MVPHADNGSLWVLKDKIDILIRLNKIQLTDDKNRKEHTSWNRQCYTNCCQKELKKLKKNDIIVPLWFEVRIYPCVFEREATKRIGVGKGIRS